MDWHSLFVPSPRVGEIFLRGSIVYLFLFFLFRVLRRQAGAIGIQDLLVVVLIADAAQNAMAGEYKSITEGLLLVATIVFWDYLFDWLGYRFPKLRRLLKPMPLVLVDRGRLQHENLRTQLITEEELIEKLRQQGVGHVEEVEKSYLEGDGHISVITAEPRSQKGQSDKNPLQ